MGNAYAHELRKAIADSAAKANVTLKDAVAAQVNNFLLNSSAEGTYASSLGAQVLVSGVVPEVVVSRHIRLNCAALCIVKQSLVDPAASSKSNEIASAISNVISVVAKSL
jgi:purine nucleoside phosphorylase